MIDKITPEFLESIGIFELREIAREIGVYSPTTLKRDILVNKILDIYEGRAKPIIRNNRGRPVKTSGNAKDIVSSVKSQAELNYEFNESDKSMLILREPITTFDAIAYEDNQQCAGILDITNEGYGIVRVKNYSASELDAYLSHLQIKSHNLRSGDLIQGIISKNHEKKFNNMHTILAINDVALDKVSARKNFESLTPVYPDKKILNYNLNNSLNVNILSLTAPLGKGQRAFLYASDKFVKMEVFIDLANTIKKDNPDTEVLTLLLGELPEEVTEIKRAVLGDIIFSTFDDLPVNHIKVSELVLARAKRLTEAGKDAILLIDNLNILARAYHNKEAKENNTEHSFYLLKRFFGAARNIEESGSLSIIAFINYDTNVDFDDLMYKDLKGIANSEIYIVKEKINNELLIDIVKSDTSRKELLLNETELECGRIIKKEFEINRENASKNILPLLSNSLEKLKEALKK